MSHSRIRAAWAHTIALSLVATASLHGTARASTLALNCELLSSGLTPSPCPGPTMLPVPGDYTNINGFTGTTGTMLIAGSDINGSEVGFIDAYIFQIDPAKAEAFSATIQLDGQFGINDLYSRLYMLGSNPGGLVAATPAGTVYNGVVQTVGGLTTVKIGMGAPIDLAAGSYVMEVSGIAPGNGPSGYVTNINLETVPLPAGLPLLLSGLGALGWMLRPRSSRALRAQALAA